MNSFEIKVFMLAKGLTITSMSKELCRNNSTKITSMQTMISDMIYGRRYYPGLAKKLEKKFGLQIKRSAQFEPVSEVIKQSV